MGTKVYILITGPRDDRRTSAVFTSREKAEAALRFGDKGSEVEEFELDAPLPSAPAGHSLWHVQEYFGHRAMRMDAFGWEDPIGQVVCEDGCCEVNVWARDEDHALHAGQELFGQFTGRSGGAVQR